MTSQDEEVLAFSIISKAGEATSLFYDALEHLKSDEISLWNINFEKAKGYLALAQRINHKLLINESNDLGIELSLIMIHAQDHLMNAIMTEKIIYEIGVLHMNNYKPRRKEIMKDFLWGSATASYQCEGAWDRDGKGLSNWDVFCHSEKNKINNSNGDEASNHYYTYEEDIKMLSEGGQNSYRFSLSWPRIIPNGIGEINDKGIQHYHDVIDTCHKYNVIPNVTLFHWDLPNTLEEAGGWENPLTAQAFAEYAKVCFREYGNKVNLWVTINEPSYFTQSGYAIGNYPPNVKNFNRFAKAAYHVMLASALATIEYRKFNFKNSQIGLVHATSVINTLDNSPESLHAARLADNYYNNWIFDPAFLGKFPKDLYQALQDKNIDLSFIKEKHKQLFMKGIVDFAGVNYYSRALIKPYSGNDTILRVNNKGDGSQDTIKISNWFERISDPAVKHTKWGSEIYPEGLLDTLQDIQSKYGNIPIYITENGVGLFEKMKENKIDDQERIEFMSSHIEQVIKASDQGYNLKGYYVWSSFDLYSWINGYEKRYGLVYVDFKTQKRYPKESYYWYKNYIESLKEEHLNGRK